MRLLLVALGAAMFATAAHAETGPLLAHGTLDGARTTYLGCVYLAPDTATSYCFAAVPDGGGVTVTSVVSPLTGPATVRTASLPPEALTAGTYGIRSTVRLAGTLPGLGAVDLTSYSEPTLTNRVVNDLCTPSPLHAELVATAPVASLVAWTDGTVGGVGAQNLHGCASALAVGPVTGAWRMASGL